MDANTLSNTDPDVDPPKVLAPINLNTQSLTTIVGIFLLILAVSGNFVAETLSCQMQKLLSSNMIAKNTVIMMIIYFALGLSSDNTNDNPLTTMMRSVVIWMFFVIFNKMSVYFGLVAIAGLFGILLCKDYAEYYQKLDSETHSDTYRDTIQMLVNTIDKLFIGICLTILVGFTVYFRKQYATYYRTFSYTTFLFGNTKCASM